MFSCRGPACGRRLAELCGRAFVERQLTKHDPRTLPCTVTQVSAGAAANFVSFSLSKFARFLLQFRNIWLLTVNQTEVIIRSTAYFRGCIQLSVTTGSVLAKKLLRNPRKIRDKIQTPQKEMGPPKMAARFRISKWSEPSELTCTTTFLKVLLHDSFFLLLLLLSLSTFSILKRKQSLNELVLLYIRCCYSFTKHHGGLENFWLYYYIQPYCNFINLKWQGHFMTQNHFHQNNDKSR